MQPLDIQKDIQPTSHAEKAGEKVEKKIQGKQNPKGDAFSDMIKKILTESSESSLVNSFDPDTEMIAGGMEDTKRKNLLKQCFDSAKNSSKQKNILTDTLPSTEEEPDIEASFLFAQLLSANEQEAPAALAAGKNIPITDTAPSNKDSDAAALSASAAEWIMAENNEKPVLKKEITASQERSDTPHIIDDSENGEKTLTAFEHSIENTSPKPPKPIVSVVDERTSLYAALHTDFSGDENFGAVTTENNNTLDMMCEFRGAAYNTGTQYESGLFSKEPSTPSFTSLLAQQVQDMAADFVQAGKIILQDNSAGVIRLQMQPAYLGSVKINLELAGGKQITGKIVAASKETYEAFKESIEQLTAAFEQGGFENVQFDVSWSGESGNNYFAQEDSSFENSFAKNQQVEVMGNSRYADAQIVYDSGYNHVVNVFA